MPEPRLAAPRHCRCRARPPSPRATAAAAALLVDRTLSRQTPSLLWPLPPADSRCLRPVYESPRLGHLHCCYDSLHREPAMLNRRSDSPLNCYGRPGPCRRRRCTYEPPLRQVTFYFHRSRAKWPATVVDPRVLPSCHDRAGSCPAPAAGSRHDQLSLNRRRDGFNSRPPSSKRLTCFLLPPYRDSPHQHLLRPRPLPTYLALALNRPR